MATPALQIKPQRSVHAPVSLLRIFIVSPFVAPRFVRTSVIPFPELYLLVGVQFAISIIFSIYLNFDRSVWWVRGSVALAAGGLRLYTDIFRLVTGAATNPPVDGAATSQDAVPARDA